MVAPFTKHSKNTEAKLYSQLLTGPTCLRLEVLMFRRNVNYLSIKIIHKEAQTSSEIVRYNGPQGQQWVPMEHSIFLPESLSYQVKILRILLFCKVGRVFPMVIWSEFRLGEYRNDDHRENAPHFTCVDHHFFKNNCFKVKINNSRLI